MFTIDVKMGRLLEFRAMEPSMPEDLDVERQRMTHFFQTIPGKVVVCADFSRATIFSPEVATKVVDVLRYDNPRIERSGFLVSDSAIFSLQLERLVNQAGNPARKCFRDPFDLKVFLGPNLTHEEHSRLAQFLSDPVDSPVRRS